TSDSPLNSTSPWRGGSTPQMQRSVVVFPAPLLPSRVTISFSFTLSESENSTCTSPYPALIPRTSSMLLPQVRLDHRGVLHDLLRRSRGNQLARVEHDDVLAEAHHRGHHVLDHQDRDTLLVADAPDERHHVPRLDRVHPGDDLVEEQRLRCAGERTRHLQLLASGQRQARRVLVAPLVEADELQHLVGELAGACIVPARALGGGHRAVLEQGEVRERSDDLVRADDPGAGDEERRTAGDLLVLEEHPPRSRGNGPGEHRKAGGLSRSVRADQTEDLSLLQRQRDVVVRLQAAESLRQTLRAQDRRHFASRGAAGAPVAATGASSTGPPTARSGRTRWKRRRNSPVRPSGSKRITKISSSPYNPR